MSLDLEKTGCRKNGSPSKIYNNNHYSCSLSSEGDTPVSSQNQRTIQMCPDHGIRISLNNSYSQLSQPEEERIQWQLVTVLK